MKRTLLYSAIVSVLLSACGDSGTSVNNANVSNGNTSVSKTNTIDPLAPTTPTPQQTTNNAPTLSPVYKAYCAAWVKKDEAGLRRVYSSDTLKNFEEQMKDEKVKSLVEFLSDDQASNELCETRNEVITGDTAVAEVRTEGYPNGIRIIFVKENGEWKMTNRQPAGALK